MLPLEKKCRPKMLPISGTSSWIKRWCTQYHKTHVCKSYTCSSVPVSENNTSEGIMTLNLCSHEQETKWQDTFQSHRHDIQLWFQQNFIANKRCVQISKQRQTFVNIFRQGFHLLWVHCKRLRTHTEEVALGEQTWAPDEGRRGVVPKNMHKILFNFLTLI